MEDSDRRRDREAELDRELQDHLDLESDEQQRGGLSLDDARRAARFAFGNPAAVREDVREAWGWRWLERFSQDVHLAVRLWMRTPALSLIAIATIGLGVGASTALVGQIKAVFWTPLPVAQPQSLRIVVWTSPRRSFVYGPNVMAGPSVNGVSTYATVSYPAYLAMRDEAMAFSDIACWADLGEARPVILGEHGFATVQFVSGNFFRTLGVGAALGRTIEPGDQVAFAWSPVVMISHSFWQRAFGGAADVTGRTLRLNGRTFAIVGVMPEGFFGVDPSVSPDLVVPNGAVEVAAATPNPLQNRGLWNPCRVIARIAPGRSDEEARLDLERALAASIAAAPPSEPYDPPRVWLVPAEYGLSTLRDGTATPLIVLLVVVGTLLLAASTNIAGLLLARGGARSREIATRLALGATRARVTRQLMTESLVLAGAGGAAGLLLAYWFAGSGAALLSQFMPTLFGSDRSLAVMTALDGPLIAIGIGVSLLSGLLFGAMPAIRATRLDLSAVIKENARAGERRYRLTGGQAMVAVQTALAIVLLIGAGLLLRTVNNLRHTDLGFDAQGLLYARVEPRSGGVPQIQRLQFFEDAVARLRGLPGIASAAAVAIAPLGGDVSVGVANFIVPVCPPMASRDVRQPDMVPINAVSPGYFETMRVPMRAGRDFTAADLSIVTPSQTAVARVLIVNESFAQKYFPSMSAVGQEIRTVADCPGPGAPLTIIGVVADSRSDIRTEVTPTLFVPLGGFSGPVTLIARTAVEPSSMISGMRRALTELNANTPTFSEATAVDIIDRRLRRERLLSMLLAVFAGVTTFICCLGIYGLLAYAVERRRQEISVRMAIGAQARDVIRMMVRESLVPVAIGVTVGVALSIAADRWLAQVLYGVSSYDALTLGAAAAVFLLVGILAAFLPARAAARVSPVLALRQ
jgi:predicted permease